MDEFRAFVPAAPAGTAQFDALTRRERELVELIAQGRNNLQIATQLGLSAKTVRNHVTNIFAKLGVENRAQAIVLARNAGIGTRRP
jgi:DNA-binding NarL/FixJ family response regulator